jgi:hypothetical protein
MPQRINIVFQGGRCRKEPPSSPPSTLGKVLGKAALFRLYGLW